MNGIRAGGRISLTEGSIAKGLLSFSAPLFIGNLLQQLYNLTDAWVIGNFSNNDSFAAVSSSGSISFFVIGLFNGIAMGGGVVISRYFGAKDEENVSRAIHNNFCFGLIASAIATVFGLLLVPIILKWMKVPDSVMPYALTYFQIYFGGVSTIIMYNICMSIMRAVGDSLHPLYYLILSSAINIILDLVFVIAFDWGVAGVASATIIAQGISALLCLKRMLRMQDCSRLDFRKLKLYPGIFRQVVAQGLPSGIQNSVISIGNMVIQGSINTFGAFAMSGHGAYARIEGLVFLPITSVAMSLPTFVSQNLGASEYDRVRKGAKMGILFGVISAEIVGIVFYTWAPFAIKLFVDSPAAMMYGRIQAQIVSPFFCLLAFSHCCAGVLRGCGKAVVPMMTMLAFWCAVRIVYVTTALRFINEYQVIAWAYPLTWFLSTIVFAIVLLKIDLEKCVLK